MRSRVRSDRMVGLEDRLRGTRIFGDLEPDAVSAIARGGVVRWCGPGTVLFREGQPVAGLILLLEGEVQEFRTGTSGREQVLHLRGAGDVLGGMPLGGQAAQTCTGRVSRPTRIVMLPAVVLNALHQRYPAMVGGVIRELTERVQALERTMARVALVDVQGRVAGALVEQLDPGGAGVSVPPGRRSRSPPGWRPPAKASRVRCANWSGRV